MSDRLNLLNKIISYEDVSEAIFKAVVSYSWDYNDQPALLIAQDIDHVLNLYLKSAITSENVNKWADFLECREDVDCDEAISAIFFELANPDIYEKLTPARAKLLIKQL